MKNNKKLFNVLQELFKVLFYLFKLFFKGLILTLKVIIKIIPLFFGFLGAVVNRFKKLFRFSITFKITTVYAFIFALLLLGSSIIILLGFRFYLFEQVRQEIKGNSQDTGYVVGWSAVIPENQLSLTAEREKIIITVFDENKDILYSTGATERKVRFYPYFDTPVIKNTEDKQIVVFNSLINQNNMPLYIQITKDLDLENMYIRILFIVLMVVNGLSVLTAILIGSKVSKKMLSPIETMTKTVKSITINNLDKRLDVSGAHDELKELAQTFNKMIDHIQGSYDRQNQFVSDASHELRTPISVIQGYANLLDRWGKDDRKVLEESISAVKSESENMKDLTEKLLFLARADKNLLKFEKEDFIINDLIDEIVKETKLIDTAHQIISDASKEIQIFADRKALKQAIRVFVDNSIKFTPSGGEIKISLYPQRKHLVITIEDTGIGIPKEDTPNIFDRFYRSDKSRSKDTGGHGLGLTIAKWIIDNHNGRIDIKSTVDVGTKISINLPYK